jgi:hypothetical protein
MMDRADLSFGCAVATGLRTLKHARNVLGNRVRRHEMHVRDKSAPLCEHRLVDCSGRAKGGFDRKRPRSLNVIEDEALALFRYRPAHVARDRAVAAEYLSAAVIDVESIDAERTDRKAPRLTAARRPCDHDHARARHRASAGLERRVRLREHIWRQIARDELAVRVDDAEPFEAYTLRGDARCGERHHSAIPLRLVLGLFEVEIVERGARDRRAGLGRARVHAVRMHYPWRNG